MIRHTDGVKQFGVCMKNEWVAGCVGCSLLLLLSGWITWIDEQLWWGRLFINIHVIQYSGSSSSKLEPTPPTAHSYWRCMAVCGRCYSQPSAPATPNEY